MKRRVLVLTAAFMLAGSAAGTTVLAEEIENCGVSVIADSESTTGYTVEFTYANEEATNVSLVGGFQFYKSGDIHVYANGLYCLQMIHNLIICMDRMNGLQVWD